MAAGIVKTMQKECSICGAKMEINLDEKGKILKGGYFWDFRDNGKGFEYWECKKCYKE